MKILYISNFADETGWSQFHTNQVLAMNAVGIDVVPHVVRMNDKPYKVHPVLEELQRKNTNDCDVLIQGVLPHFVEYNSRFRRNIAYPLLESSNFRASSWSNHLNLVDEIWTACEHNKYAVMNSFVDMPVRVIPMAVDTKIYKKSYPILPLKKQYEGDFIFYTIGEFSRRKNLQTVLKAFHSEFDPNDPVQLVIKTTPNGIEGNPQETISKLLNDVKTGLKIFSSNSHYKEDRVFCQNWTEEEIYSLHKSADCYVSASLGEAVNIPCVDAMGFGNPVIVPDFGGFQDYVGENCGMLVQAHEDNCFGNMETFGDLYTANEDFGYVSVRELRICMRAMFENRDSMWFEEFKTVCPRNVEKFSLQNIGKEIGEALSDI